MKEYLTKRPLAPVPAGPLSTANCKWLVTMQFGNMVYVHYHGDDIDAARAAIDKAHGFDWKRAKSVRPVIKAWHLLEVGKAEK